MSLFRKLFSSKSKSDKEEDQKDDARSKYMPKPELPTDENFVYHFKNNGGKFLYCQDQNEVKQVFGQILDENDWKNAECCCFDDNLKQTFKDFNLDFTFNGEASFFLSTCEYLIANKGTVLICHHQLKDYKLESLPDFFIVFSGLDNFVNDVSEGMSNLKNKYADQLPTNITTLNVKNSKDENDFLSYGNSAKNLYLVLQEH